MLFNNKVNLLKLNLDTDLKAEKQTVLVDN